VTATAFRAHTYRHPTIGWLEDLRAITRDDLYAHYRRYYVPNNAKLVVVGDVEADEVIRAAERHFGAIAPGADYRRPALVEPAQLGERRVLLEREGTTAYLKFAYHAPAATEPDFFPMLVLDAILSGAKGVNLWTSFRGTPPQRKARLYTALVEQGLASLVSGAILPTAQPFLYSISLTAMKGVGLSELEDAASDAIELVRTRGVDATEVARAQRQLRARLVFENDGVTNVAHQLGYFDTVVGPGFFQDLQRCIDTVTPEQVSDVARRRLSRTARTTGWFQPQESRR
jgi:zinc protease